MKKDVKVPQGIAHLIEHVESATGFYLTVHLQVNIAATKSINA
jgi:hypothetical protein